MDFDDEISAWEPQRNEDVPLVEGLDGVHTPETVRLATVLNASGFNLNSWWAFTPSDWACPCCQRPKEQIARVKNRTLYGHLVVHHDHMRDLISKHFDQCALDGTRAEIPQHARTLARRLENFILSFDETLICADCNTADAIGKQEAQTPPEFSFAPPDIFRFINSSPHQPHQVDRLKARTVWEKRKPFYELRVKIVKRITEIALGQENWYQPSPGKTHPDWILENRPDHITQIAQGRLRKHAIESGQKTLCLDDYAKLAAPRLAPRTAPQSWRTQGIQRRAKPVLDHQITAVAALDFQYWNMVPNDWVCPCCQREKRAIVQWNSRNQLTFPPPPERYPSGKGKKGEPIRVCNECSRTIGHLAKEAEVKPEFVVFSDVQLAVTPQVNASHLPKSTQEIDRVINSIQKRVPPCGRKSRSQAV